LLLEYAIKLEAEKDLGAEDQQAAFMERDLDLAFKLHGPSDIVPGLAPSRNSVLTSESNAGCARSVPKARNLRRALCVQG
jgi:hypothetical protein